jgi:RimJ/RimL family protein N-acetyltransferase
MPLPSRRLAPVTLAGAHVRLDPLSVAHIDALCAVGLDASLWTYSTTPMRGPDDMRRYVDAALAEQARGTALPFVHVDQATGRVAGSTRFANYAPEHGRVEIGWTWVAGPWQRTAVNTEAKRLMFAHAFDVLGAGRVELKADARNARSRAAMLRLGAPEEGVLRRHMATHTGYVRDTVYHSVLADEWPAVRARLDARLAAGRNPEPD